MCGGGRLCPSVNVQTCIYIFIYLYLEILFMFIVGRRQIQRLVCFSYASLVRVVANGGSVVVFNAVC